MNFHKDQRSDRSGVYGAGAALFPVGAINPQTRHYGGLEIVVENAFGWVPYQFPDTNAGLPAPPPKMVMRSMR